MQKQILDDIDKHLFPHLYGYGKENSTQTSLISMLEKWKLSIGAIRKVRTQVGERGGGWSQSKSVQLHTGEGGAMEREYVCSMQFHYLPSVSLFLFVCFLFSL